MINKVYVLLMSENRVMIMCPADDSVDLEYRHLPNFGSPEIFEYRLFSGNDKIGWSCSSSDIEVWHLVFVESIFCEARCVDLDRDPIIYGSWDNWKTPLEFRTDTNHPVLAMRLPAGTYHYKMFINDLQVFYRGDRIESDGNGNKFNVLTVG